MYQVQFRFVTMLSLRNLRTPTDILMRLPIIILHTKAPYWIPRLIGLSEYRMRMVGLRRDFILNQHWNSNRYSMIEINTTLKRQLSKTINQPNSKLFVYCHDHDKKGGEEKRKSICRLRMNTSINTCPMNITFVCFLSFFIYA